MIARGVLVSVRDAGEASAALAGGACVIDVKNPAEGSLGRAAPAAIAKVATLVGHRAPWTIAAGELAAGVEPLATWVAAVKSALPGDAAGPAALKVGLAGMVNRSWEQDLARVHASLPAGCRHAAVVYADFDRVEAPAPLDVIAAAARIGCGLVLVDTADKRGPGLFGLRSHHELAGWVAAARAHRLGVVLAGRIAIAEIPQAVALAPDCVALRSAVCSNAGRGDVRLGSVSETLVAAAVSACTSLARTS